jgi:hypothetical protein
MAQRAKSREQRGSASPVLRSSLLRREDASGAVFAPSRKTFWIGYRNKMNGRRQIDRRDACPTLTPLASPKLPSEGGCPLTFAPCAVVGLTGARPSHARPSHGRAELRDAHDSGRLSRDLAHHCGVMLSTIDSRHSTFVPRPPSATGATRCPTFLPSVLCASPSALCPLIWASWNSALIGEQSTGETPALRCSLPCALCPLPFALRPLPCALCPVPSRFFLQF